MDDDNPIPRLEAKDSTDIIIVTKHAKIIHKIYTKMHTLIRSSYGLLNESNYTLILTQIMRQLNKHNIYGFEKKQLAVELTILLLDSTGCPDAASRFTVEVTISLIEMIYNYNMHRYKTNSKCIII